MEAEDFGLGLRSRLKLGTCHCRLGCAVEDKQVGVGVGTRQARDESV